MEADCLADGIGVVFLLSVSSVLTLSLPANAHTSLKPFSKAKVCYCVLLLNIWCEFIPVYSDSEFLLLSCLASLHM